MILLLSHVQLPRVTVLLNDPTFGSTPCILQVFNLLQLVIPGGSPRTLSNATSYSPPPRNLRPCLTHTLHPTQTPHQLPEHLAFLITYIPPEQVQKTSGTFLILPRIPCCYLPDSTHSVKFQAISVLLPLHRVLQKAFLHLSFLSPSVATEWFQLPIPCAS